jgi:hypothetical protein
VILNCWGPTQHKNASPCSSLHNEILLYILLQRSLWWLKKREWCYIPLNGTYRIGREKAG